MGYAMEIVLFIEIGHLRNGIKLFHMKNIFIYHTVLHSREPIRKCLLCYGGSSCIGSFGLQLKTKNMLNSSKLHNFIIATSILHTTFYSCFLLLYMLREL